MPQTDAALVAIVQRMAGASSMAGEPARACGTNALPGLGPVLPADRAMSGARGCEPVSRADGRRVHGTAMAAPTRGSELERPAADLDLKA
jgi:hypothetical protein